MDKDTQKAKSSEQGVKKKRFADFFLSIRPNGSIGCLEYVILTVAGLFFPLLMFIALGASSFPVLFVPGLLTGNYASGFGVFLSLSFAIFAVFLALTLAYHARLLQLRMIDIGLGSNLAVPALASNFWCCLIAVIAVSIFSLLGLLLLIFCCIWQGKTYKDNRDLFRPIAPVPPAAELARQMRERD